MDSSLTKGSQFPGAMLEQYSLRHPQEVLLVEAVIDRVEDQVMVFRGFSSSLMNPTNFDPDIPVLPEGAKIVAIARLQGPYNPADPRVIESGLSWDVFEQRYCQ